MPLVVGCSCRRRCLSVLSVVVVAVLRYIGRGHWVLFLVCSSS